MKKYIIAIILILTAPTSTANATQLYVNETGWWINPAQLKISQDLEKRKKPHIQALDELLEEETKYKNWQKRKLSMKPGLTCFWQISGRSEITDFDKWIEMDLDYIDNWSLWLDLKILANTIPVIITGRGAY